LRVMSVTSGPMSCFGIASRRADGPFGGFRMARLNEHRRLFGVVAAGSILPGMVAGLLVLLGVLLMPVPAQGQGAGGAVPAAAEQKHVTLVVEYGEGVEKRWSRLDWKAGVTVAQVLSAADAMPGPLGLELVARGDGERFFVKEIDGLANQGGGKADRNWLFFVNGEMAKKSAGIVEVSAGDTIVWRYIPFDWTKGP
jgi:hypothetical protein